MAGIARMRRKAESERKSIFGQREEQAWRQEGRRLVDSRKLGTMR